MEEQYICIECGLIFEEPKTYKIDTTPGGAFEGGSFMYEYEACPRCEGSYTKAEQCVVCMDWKIEENGEYIDNDFLCEDCLEKLEEE